ncbi:two-component system response regulator DctR [Oxalobacteraceae bacterium GrIS 2.11]
MNRVAQSNKAGVTLPSGPPHIAMIDDDGGVRHSTGMLMETRAWLFTEFERATDFLEKGVPSHFNCLIIDIRIPGMSGIELFNALLTNAKKNHEYVPPALFLSGHGDIPMAVQLMHQGAVDFLEKPVNHRTLLDAIESTLQADRVRRETFLTQYELIEEIAKLTHREREVLTEIVSGYLSKQIAQRLHISTKTVEAHRLRICQKFNTRTSMELAAKLRDVPNSLWQLEKKGPGSLLARRGLLRAD